MAISSMAKVMIVCHRSQASDLLESLQAEGICQILGAEEAAISKNEPDVTVSRDRPRDVDDLVSRLERDIAFLKDYASAEKGLANALAPRKIIDEGSFKEVITDADLLRTAEQAEQLQVAMDKIRGEIEHIQATLDMLRPWVPLGTPVEEIGRLRTSTSWAGLVGVQHLGQCVRELTQQGAAVQRVGTAGAKEAVIVVALREGAEPIQKLLRSYEVEIVTFESMAGVPAELVGEYEEKLLEAQEQLAAHGRTAESLSAELLRLKILHDHYSNVRQRELARAGAPRTQQTVLFEAWVRREDYDRLTGVIGRFDAANVVEIQPSEGESIPVEIANTVRSEPFESITRLYGMPHPTDVDPTPFLAPFFALFFGICLTDAVYGIVMFGILWWLHKRMQGAGRFLKMMMICAVPATVAGALTGGWCGDAIQKFFPALSGVRNALMWFDPIEKPMYFFVISLALGYLQIIFGIGVAFWHKWKRGLVRDAILDHGTWFVWLNSLTIFGLAKAGYLPASLGTAFGVVAIIPALGIVLFSERSGNWGMRIGMGCYNVFSTVFYVGDVLSYIRLMALGMVTAGFGMAINDIVARVMAMGVLGWILGGLVFVGGHLFNIANSALSAFVHSMRLQFVEFFTKFLEGGGRQFEPLRNEYKHIQLGE